MPRTVIKGPAYGREARTRALKASIAGPLVIIGIVLTGVSMFSLLGRLFDLHLPPLTDTLLEKYRGVFYPPIEYSGRLLNIEIPDMLKDLASLYALLGGILQRPLKAIYQYASNTDFGASVYEYPFGKLGSRLDAFFNWAQERLYNRITWWRRPLFWAGSILVMPLTVFVFTKYPHTMKTGGAMGTYQDRRNDPSDTATFDTAHFDTRIILGVQLGLSAIVTGSLVLVAVLA